MLIVLFCRRQPRPTQYQTKSLTPKRLKVASHRNPKQPNTPPCAVSHSTRHPKKRTCSNGQKETSATDPVNATLWGYKAHNVHQFNILDGDEIKTRNFAAVIEMTASAKDSVLIGNGISAFIPLSYYVISRKQQL